MKSLQSSPKCALTHNLCVSVAALTAFFTAASLLLLHSMWSRSSQLEPSISTLSNSTSFSFSPPSPPPPSSDCIMFSLSNSTSTTTIQPHSAPLGACTSDQECGSNSVCHLKQCKCFLGYRSNSSEQCERVPCTSDENCLNFAYTRCNIRNSLCQCQEEDYYLDWNSQSCRFSYLSSLQMIERSVPIVVVFVALILLSSAFARCYYLRRRGRRSAAAPDNEEAAALPAGRSTSTAVHFFSVYDQIVASDTVHYPPPPPYTVDYIKPPEEVKADNRCDSSTCSHYSTPPPPYPT